jgi:hypothetical protein
MVTVGAAWIWRSTRTMSRLTLSIVSRARCGRSLPLLRQLQIEGEGEIRLAAADGADRIRAHPDGLLQLGTLDGEEHQERLLGSTSS